jgi:ABC-type nitrate/sulfonate/bicarbonate transport system permease component
MKERIKSGIIDPQIWRALVGILVFLGLWYLLTAVFALPRFKLIPDPVRFYLSPRGDHETDAAS